ncbi:MAG: 3-methyl-2-oxobutanoate hydroxymethyltransferase [Polyangia bacterium]|jgi:3-methyl-2-oxobutanoate hydroxymethyltransferase|nr:3-methyl-2-oxobutanoate hydroxymethyltransferase [Polyangia bacterium]
MADATVRKKKSILDFKKMKKKGEKVVWITSYDHPTATFAEQAGVDMILVGDSLGMCIYGYSSTVPVTMDQCIWHSEAVRRGAPNTFVVGDMPFMSYQRSPEDAVSNAGRFYKEAAVDAIKLEGGRRVVPQVRAILDAGMVVCGHIGLTPQSTGQFGGYKAQGRTAESGIAMVEDALALAEAGIQFLLLEAVTPPVAKAITDLLDIPVYSIGAGLDCDGQLLIVSDLIGEFQAFTPKFVKKYGNVAEVTRNAIAAYAEEVRSKAFPSKEHCYPIIEGEWEKFAAMLERVKRPG